MQIGMVGMGFMGATHLAAFGKLPDVHVAAICATNERVLSGDLTEVGGNLKLPGAKYDFSAVRKCSRWQDLVNDPDLDAIDICLPTDLHAAVATAAMQAGKHVLCEKPMALTVADCKHMLDVARQDGRILMIGQVLRFWPEYLKLQEFVTGEAHGRVEFARFVRTCGLPDWSRWLPLEERSGGAVLDLLVHDIDQALLLFGMPGRIAATSLGGADTISATFAYENGLHVQIEGGWLAAGTPFAMSFEARSHRALLELSADGLFLDSESGRNAVQPEAGDAYHQEVAYFVECCRTGNRPDLCLPEASANAVRIALLLKESRAKEGEPIEC